jgi:hypothetical protein
MVVVWQRASFYGMEKTVNVLSQALSERLCKLAIDLNNDLGVISGHCQLMMEHAELPAECEERLRQILASVSKMAKRINGHECRMTCSAAQSEIYEDDVRKPGARVTPSGLGAVAEK